MEIVLFNFYRKQIFIQSIFLKLSRKISSKNIKSGVFFRTIIIVRMKSEFGQIEPGTACVVSLRVCLVPPYPNGENFDNTLTPLFLIGSSSFLQVIRTIIIVQMSSKFGQIGGLRS